MGGGRIYSCIPPLAPHRLKLEFVFLFIQKRFKFWRVIKNVLLIWYQVWEVSVTQYIWDLWRHNWPHLTKTKMATSNLKCIVLVFSSANGYSLLSTRSNNLREIGWEKVNTFSQPNLSLHGNILSISTKCFHFSLNILINFILIKIKSVVVWIMRTRGPLAIIASTKSAPKTAREMFLRTSWNYIPT